MAWGTELSVDTGGSQLAEQVFVQISLGVPLGEWQGVDHVDGRYEQRRLLDHELRILHILTELGSVHCHTFEVREHLVPHMGKHLIGPEMLILLPAQLLLVIAEHPAAHGLAGPLGLFLVAALVDVHQATEHEERDLFDHRQRVGHSTGPEFFPQFVNAAFKRSGYHLIMLLLRFNYCAFSPFPSRGRLG